MNQIHFRNEHLDRLKHSNIANCYKLNKEDDSLCPYGLVILTDNTTTVYWYYVKWQRDKDYKNLKLKGAKS